MTIFDASDEYRYCMYDSDSYFTRNVKNNAAKNRAGHIICLICAQVELYISDGDLNYLFLIKGDDDEYEYYLCNDCYHDQIDKIVEDDTANQCMCPKYCSHDRSDQ